MCGACPLKIFHDESTVHNAFHSRYGVSSHTGEGDDYTLPDTFEATFTVGSMLGDTACSDPITIVDDPDLEGTHNFGVQVSRTTPSGSQIMLPSPITVEIQDNDGT